MLILTEIHVQLFRILMITTYNIMYSQWKYHNIIIIRQLVPFFKHFQMVPEKTYDSAIKFC